MMLGAWGGSGILKLGEQDEHEMRSVRKTVPDVF